MVVVFPAPLGPRKPCTSPVCTVKSSPSRARVLPNVLTSPSARIASVTVTLPLIEFGDFEARRRGHRAAPLASRSRTARR